MASGNKKTGGMACCIPSCLSKQYRDGVETGISLFRFPQIKKMKHAVEKSYNSFLPDNEPGMPHFLGTLVQLGSTGTSLSSHKE